MATNIWSRDNLHVDVSINEAGDLVFAGQDLDPPPIYGDEYEYWVTVRAADLPKVVAALGGTPGDDVIALISAHAEPIVRTGAYRWLTGLGITTELYTYY